MKLLALASVLVAGMIALGCGTEPSAGDRADARLDAGAAVTQMVSLGPSDAPTADAHSGTAATQEAVFEVVPELGDPSPQPSAPQTEPTSGVHVDDAPDSALNPATTLYVAVIETVGGRIEIELWPELAPDMVGPLVSSARDGFYDRLEWHRVLPGFVIQGGDFMDVGVPAPGLMGETTGESARALPLEAGAVALAPGIDPDYAFRQLFIVTENVRSVWNPQVIGHVVRGLDVARAVRQGDRIKSVDIHERPVDERSILPGRRREVNGSAPIVDAAVPRSSGDTGTLGCPVGSEGSVICLYCEEVELMVMSSLESDRIASGMVLHGDRCVVLAGATADDRRRGIVELCQVDCAGTIGWLPQRHLRVDW